MPGCSAIFSGIEAHRDGVGHQSRHSTTKCGWDRPPNGRSTPSAAFYNFRWFLGLLGRPDDQLGVRTIWISRAGLSGAEAPIAVAWFGGRYALTDGGRRPPDLQTGDVSVSEAGGDVDGVGSGYRQGFSRSILRDEGDAHAAARRGST